MYYEYDLTCCTNKSRLRLIQDERIDLPPLVGISMMLNAMQHSDSCAVHVAMPKHTITTVRIDKSSTQPFQMTGCITYALLEACLVVE